MNRKNAVAFSRHPSLKCDNFLQILDFRRGLQM